MGSRTPPRFVTQTMVTIVTLIVREGVRRTVIAAARAARKSSLVAFTRP